MVGRIRLARANARPIEVLTEQKKETVKYKNWKRASGHMCVAAVAEVATAATTTMVVMVVATTTTPTTKTPMERQKEKNAVV